MKKNKSKKIKRFTKTTKIIIGISTIGVITLSVILPIVTISKNLINKNKDKELINVDKKVEIYWEYNDKKYKTYEKAYDALVTDYKKLSDGSGNTYTQAQIEHVKVGNFVAPENAVEGLNSPGKIEMKLDDPLSRENAEIITQLIAKLNPFGGLSQPTFSPSGNSKEKVKWLDFSRFTVRQIQDKGFKNSDALKFESLIKKDAWSNRLITGNLSRYDKVDLPNKKIKWHASEISPKIGDGSGNTYTQAQIAARDATAPFPSQEDAQSGLSIVGPNIAQVNPTGDGSGNTYTQAQIDHAKGGNFAAPKFAKLGFNIKYNNLEQLAKELIKKITIN